MSLQCFNDPYLLDFLKICAAMPADERAQLEAFTGQPYDVDGAAVGNYTAPGPKWVIKNDGVPLVVGGFVPQRPGVYRDFLLTTPDAFAQFAFPITRICRRIMDAMLISVAHRIECIVPAPRLESRPELVKWYKVLGYEQEQGRRYGYCANGADAIGFARVKH
jgi:hypothetical protein